MCKCQDCNCNGSGSGFSNFYDEFTGGRYANFTANDGSQQNTTTTTTNSSDVNYAQVLQSFLAGLGGQGVPTQASQISDAIVIALKGQIQTINSNSTLTQDQKDEQVKALLDTAIQSATTNPALTQDQKNSLVSQIQGLYPKKTPVGGGQFWQENKYFIIAGVTIAVGVTAFLIWKGKSSGKS